MHPALLHRIGDRLSAAELSACRLDGVLHEVGDAYLPADVPDSPTARALSLRPLLRPDLAAAGPSAAWLHGAGCAPPIRHHVRPITTRRLRVPSTVRIRVHEAPLSEDDVSIVAGVALSARLETLCDLARGDAEESRPWLLAMVADAPEDARAAADRLRDRRRLPGKHAAVTALERAYEEVTRYTS